MQEYSPKQNEQFHKAWGKIVAKAWTDSSFKQKLLKNPKEVFKEFGLPTDHLKEIIVHENTKDKLHLVLGQAPQMEYSEEDLNKLAGGGDWSGEACVCL